MYKKYKFQFNELLTKGKKYKVYYSIANIKQCQLLLLTIIKLIFILININNTNKMSSSNNRSKFFDFTAFSSSANHPSQISSNSSQLLERLMSNHQNLKKKYSQTHQRHKTIGYNQNDQEEATDAYETSQNETVQGNNLQERPRKYKTNFDRIQQDEQYKQKKTLKLPFLKKPRQKKNYFNRYAKLNETQESILLNYLNAKFNSKGKVKLYKPSHQDLMYEQSRSNQYLSPLHNNKKRNKKKGSSTYTYVKQRNYEQSPKYRGDSSNVQNVYIVNQSPKYNGNSIQNKLYLKSRQKPKKNWKKMGLINLIKLNKKGQLQKIDIIAPVKIDNSKYYEKTCDPSLHVQSGHCSRRHQPYQLQQKRQSRVNSRLLTEHSYDLSNLQGVRKRISRSVKLHQHYLSEPMSNRQFVQINPFNLKTYYAKIKDKTIQQNSYPATSMVKIHDFVKFPSNNQLSNFIQNYHPINGDIELYKLIKQPSFQVQFQQDKELFFGQTLKGIKHGNGVLLKKHYIFEGQFKNDKKNKGIQIIDIGMYNGSFYNQQRDGYGEFKWNNGEYYNGEWKNGKKNGSGMWSSKKGDTYIGQWIYGKVQGQGVHTTANKQKFEGEFVNFLKHGWGKETLPNEDTYQGNFYEGTPHGKGRYVWKEGDVYQGQFLKGLRTGIGILKSRYGNVYEGHFNQQEAEGLCEIKYQNGDIYQGVYKNGQKNGRGTLKRMKQKQVWDGFWKNNQFVQSVN